MSFVLVCFRALYSRKSLCQGGALLLFALMMSCSSGTDQVSTAGGLGGEIEPDISSPINTDNDEQVDLDKPLESELLPRSEFYRSEIIFPPENSDRGGYREITIRGKVNADDMTVDVNDIHAIKVNGKSTSWSLSHEGVWVVEANLGINALYLDIEIEFIDDTKHTLKRPIKNVARFIKSNLVSLNPSTNILYSVDSKLGEVVAINLVDGSYSVLNSWHTHSDKMFEELYEFKVVPEHNKAYFTDTLLNGVFSIDLDSGQRQLIKSSSSGALSDTGFVKPCGFDVDVKSDRLFLVDCDQNSVYSIQLDNGETSLVTSNKEHLGVKLGYPRTLTYDSSNNRVLLGDTKLNAIIEIDIDSGERILFSDNLNGHGPDLNKPLATLLDQENNRLIASTATMYAGQAAIVEIDLETGDRRILASSSMGEGDPLDAITSITRVSSQELIITNGGFDSPSELDLTTGDRSRITFTVPQESYDSHNASLVSTRDNFYVSSFGKIFEINKTTRERRVISSNEIGEGAPFGWLKQMALIEEENKILAVDSDKQTIVSIDIASGDRMVLSGPTVGNGEDLWVPYDIEVDLTHNRALVLGLAPMSITSVDLQNGNREVILAEDYYRSDFSLSLTLSADGNKAYIPFSTERILQVDLNTGSVSEVLNEDDGAAKWASAVLRNEQLLVVDSERSSQTLVDLDDYSITRIKDYGEESGIYSRVCSLVLDEDILYSPCGELVAIDPDTGQRMYF